ncbi:hypothetical protein K474DRAFT_1610255, partial [Panus rudis PR-1116 ss-1]
GNQHRGCGHFVILYYSGNKVDCGQPNCALSPSHMHKNGERCGCNREYTDHMRVLNLIQEPCDLCRENAFAARVGRRR